MAFLVTGNSFIIFCVGFVCVCVCVCVCALVHASVCVCT